MSHELTALYERLSHDDELQGESNSISKPRAVSTEQRERARQMMIAKNKAAGD